MSISKVAQVYYEGELYWVCTEKERAVLDAAADLPEKQLQASLLGKPFRASHQQRAFSKAELARRGVSSG